MADVVEAFLRGTAARQLVENHDQAIEENKLRAMLLKLQLDSIKAENAHREYAANQAHAEHAFEAKNLQPAAASYTSIPATGMLPGLPSMPRTGTGEIVPTEPTPVQFPALPPEVGGGAPGYTRQPITLEQAQSADVAREVLKQKIAAAFRPPTVVGQNAIAIDPASGATIATGPTYHPPGSPEDQLITAIGSGNQQAQDNILKAFELRARVTRDPAIQAQLEGLRNIQIQLGQAKLDEARKAGASANVPAGVVGDEAISGFPSEQQRVIKLIANYQMPMPSGFALRSKYWQDILSGASAYDPTFDASQYQVRLKTRQAFTSGDSAKAINSLNTAVGHLDTLSQRADELANFASGLPGTTLANRIKNAIKTSSGDPAVKNFQTARDAVAGELTNVFRGSGGAEQDVKNWQQNIDSASSPEQLKGAIHQAIALMHSRLEALQSQYEKGIGKPADFSFLTPKSAQILDRLAGSAQTIRARDPQGQLHEAPAGTPLPAGWALER